MNENEIKITKDWLKFEFIHSNHKKYIRYCDLWLSNLTMNQLIGFEAQRIGKITKSKIQH